MLPPLARADELLFRRSVSTRRDGSVEEVLDGELGVLLSDGSTFVPTPRNLRAPDGSVYGIDWSVEGDGETGSSTVSMAVWRITPTAESLGALEHRFVDEGNGDAELAAEWAAGFAAQRPATHRTTPSLGASITALLADAAGDESVVVTLSVSDVAAPAAGASTWDMLGSEPAAVLLREEERILAIEAAQTASLAALAPVEEAVAACGGSVLSRGWAAGVVRASVPTSCLAELAERPDLRRIQEPDRAGADSNDGVETRASTQVDQFHDRGVEGQDGSGLSTADRIFVVVADTFVDQDHPAWKDNTGAGRLDTVWRWDGSAFQPLGAGVDSLNPVRDGHGQAVSAILMSDITKGQDPVVAVPYERARRSGAVYQGVFDFIEATDIYNAPGSSPPFENVIDLIVERSPDVANFSFHTSVGCDLDAAENDELDALYPSMIVSVKSAGNNGHHAGDPCTVTVPSLAGSALVAGFLETAGEPDLNAGPLGPVSSMGPDVHGRAIVDLVAPGRESSALPKYNDTYQLAGAFGQTSAAAPTLAGAAALLKDWLGVEIGWSIANEIGNLHASLLLMADGAYSEGCVLSPCNSQTGTASEGDAVDKRWGAGRLRMRVFDNAGMDGPWRTRWCERLVQPGEVLTCKAHPDSSGTNQSLDEDVDRLRMAAWWFEPNLGTEEHPANIAFGAWRNGSFQYQTEGTAPGEKRLWELDPGGAAWEARLVGWCVPEEGALFDPEDPYGDCNGEGERTVYVALYWEDEDRDDGDGPAAGVQ